jgi:hypothetical protein
MSTMYNPLSQDLLLQQMHENVDEMRRARQYSAARRWRRRNRSAQAQEQRAHRAR